MCVRVCTGVIRLACVVQIVLLETCVPVFDSRRMCRRDGIQFERVTCLRGHTDDEAVCVCINHEFDQTTSASR
jgi:hypothetical protein